MLCVECEQPDEKKQGFGSCVDWPLVNFRDINVSIVIGWTCVFLVVTKGSVNDGTYSFNIQ